jgi:hypothetical protein
MRLAGSAGLAPRIATLLALALSLASTRATALPRPDIVADVVVHVDEGSASLLLLPSASEREDRASGAEAAAFGKALREAFALALASRGFVILGEKPDSAPGDEASTPTTTDFAAAARAAGAAWAAIARFSIVGSRLSYSLAVYEAGEGALVSAQAFSTYAGLGALPLIAESARSAAVKAAEYRAAHPVAEFAGSGPGGRRRIVPYRVSIASSDEGAAVSLLGPLAGDRVDLGRIEGGVFVLPYLALELGSKLEIEVSAPGRLSRTATASLGEEPIVLAVPPLGKIARQDLSVDTGPGRLLGLGIEYRLFTELDWAFISLGGRAFAGYDFLPRSSPILHSELWLGAGSYVALAPASPIRAGLCAGAGLLFSSSAAAGEGDRAFTDFALVPIEVFAECRIAGPLSLRLAARAAYSLGLDSGRVARGWMGSPLPLLFSGGLGWRF